MQIRVPFIVLDTIRSAWAALRANKMRSALTLLGIVIGVVAVVAMTAAIEGLRRSIEADMQQLGAGVFQVQKWPVMGFGPRHSPKYERRKNLTLAHVVAIEDRCTECLRVAGEAWTFGQSLTSGTRTTKSGAQIAGGTAHFFDNNGYGLERGRFFNEGEARGGANLAVVGADIVDVLWPDVDPIGQELRIRYQSYRVVGTMERRGSNFGGGSMDNLVVVPLATFLPLYGERQSLNLTIQARDPKRMERAQDQVVSILRRARGVPPEDENDFEMFSNDSLRDTFNSMAGTVAVASIGISAISLLIGGIGVMNIMLVSVTERTSEIGLRRALGARRRWILGQFIAEAVALTTAGGLLGVLLGIAASYLIRVLTGVPTMVPASAIVLSMFVSGGVGLLFGVYPAYRASRLDPVEAMRHE